jgi:hypothetical protein
MIMLLIVLVTDHRLVVCAAGGLAARQVLGADKMSAGRTGNMPVFRIDQEQEQELTEAKLPVR